MTIVAISAIKHTYHVYKKSYDIVFINKGKSISPGLPFAIL
jgi:hypothetical protein